MIVIKVMERDMIVTTTSRITSGSVNLPVKFHFKGDEWDDLVKTAVFIGSGEERDVALITDECAVPADVLAEAGGDLKIGVYGRLANGATVIPTIWGRVQYIYEGTEMGEPSPHDPEPDWTAQVQQAAATALTKAQAVEEAAARGDFDGVSPEVTIDTIAHGHSVTITDRDHPTGQSFNVLDGDSAYEQAVAGGYTGTEAQFNEELASFKELSDETKEAAPFYAEYGVTTKAEIQAAINGKRQIYLHHGSLGGIVAPYTRTFLYADIWGEGTGYRFALTNGNFQYVYELKSEWTYSIYDLTAPAQRAETAAAAAASSKTEAEGSATAAASSATAAASSATAAGNAQAAAETAQGAAEDAQAAAEAVLASIPEDYTELSGDVDELKSTFEKGTKNAYEGANIYPNTIIADDGKQHNYNQWWSTGLIPVDKTAIAYFHNTKVIITEHTDKTTPSIFKRTVVQDANLYYFDDRANYFRLSFQDTTPVGEAGFIAVYDDKFLSVVRPIIQLEDPPQSWGRENVLARARHFLDIEWTPVAPFPLCTGPYKYRIVPAGEKQVGLPYSSTRNVAKLIGVNISIHTFMTALANPRSVLYTRKITTGYLGASYYGQHCASFVAYANGDKGCAIDSLGMADIYSKEISKYELQPGDMLISAQDRTQNYGFLQHCLLVYDIRRDKYGRIDTLQIVEGNLPYAKYNAWTLFSDVESKIAKGYKCYRGNTIDATPYELCDFVKGYPDETLPQYVYPDIMPEYGDKACVEAGTDVVINVINPKTYTQIEVYKDGTLIDTRSEISDFTMADIAYGKYRFVLTDGNNTSESSLIAVAVSGTYDSNTGVVTFSCSNNAKPVAMQSYADETSKPGLGGAHNLEHLFTTEEISNGQANASTITSSAFPNVQVSFLSEYGTAVWSSQPLSDQWAPWNPNDLQILTPPVDVSTTLGTEFTMSILVNKANVNYEWQYYFQNKWNVFANSSTSELRKTPTNIAWNGWRIRCIVTDANDPTVTVTSRVAILHVSEKS